MPRTKAREAEVTGYVESGIRKPDPYEAVPAPDDRRIAVRRDGGIITLQTQAMSALGH